jgi:predicted PurR-regulated permease PerM
VAVSIVFVSIFLVLSLLLLLLIPALLRQSFTLLERLPAVLDWLQAQGLPWLQKRLGVESALLDVVNLKAQLLSYLSQAGGLAGELLATLSQSSAALLAGLLKLLLVPVVTFYLLRDWDLLVARVRHLLPRRIEPVVVKLAGEADEVLGAFLLGQLLVMLALSGIYTLGLVMVGLDFALLIGIAAGILSFVPYLGLVVGISAASAVALYQFGDLYHLLLVLLAFGVGQALEGMALTPRLVGERIGLHPVAVIFAVLAGGHLFGFFGVLLALPTAAVIMVLLRHSHDEYLNSVLYDDD